MANSPNYSMLIACPSCDLLFIEKKAPYGHKTVCPRCGDKLDRTIAHSVEKVLAYGICALLLFLPATTMPLLRFDAAGFSDYGTVVEGIIDLFLTNYNFVGLAVAAASLTLPLLFIGSTIFVSGCIYMQRYPAIIKNLFKIQGHIEEWAMLEVYLLGIFISIIKMKDSVAVSYEVGFLCFILLTLSSICMSRALDRRLFWHLIEHKGKIVTTIITTDLYPEPTARENGLQLCHNCQKIHTLEHKHCQRCGSKLHLRKPQSFIATAALTCTAFLLLLPANLYPMMKVDFLGTTTASTILDGIIYFFKEGEYFVGSVILTASILVPIFKVLGITILLVAIHFKSVKFLQGKAKLYRFITFIGRWSMLDIFVIALLTALVNLGFFTAITADTASSYFCCVVITTMVAALQLDPRLLWDNSTAQPKPAKKL